MNTIKLFISIILITGCFSLSAWAKEPVAKSQKQEAPASEVTPASQIAIIKTNVGNIHIQLDSKQAPKTVANFINYAQSGFYNNTIFHRVIDGFMIQGGGFDANMKRKVTQRPILNEADNGLKNTRGSIAMARTSDPHSATSQFFINVNNNSNLDFTSKTTRGWGYAVFGSVIQGMDIVDTIRKTATGAHGFHQNVPLSPIIIEAVTIAPLQKKAPAPKSAANSSKTKQAIQ